MPIEIQSNESYDGGRVFIELYHDTETGRMRKMVYFNRSEQPLRLTIGLPSGNSVGFDLEPTGPEVRERNIPPAAAPQMQGFAITTQWPSPIEGRT